MIKANRPFGMRRQLVSLSVVLVLGGCGVGNAVRDTAGVFDNLGCASRDLKGEAPCPPPDKTE